MAVSKNQELAWQTRWFAWWHWWASALPTAINPLGTAPKRQEETVNYSNSRAHVMMNISSRQSSLLMVNLWKNLPDFWRQTICFCRCPAAKTHESARRWRELFLCEPQRSCCWKSCRDVRVLKQKKVPFIDRGISKTRPPVSRHLKYKSSNTKVMKGNQNWNT